MEEIVDLHKVKFTSSNQFLVGERVKVIGYTNPAISSYSDIINNVGVVYSNFDSSILNGYFAREKEVYICINTSSYRVDVADLDLAIEDEKLYNEIKSVRLAQSELYLKYREIEIELLKKKLYNDNKDILEIFEEVYSNQFDYNFDNGQLNCLIHFPEITITNSERMSHKIVDLYIKISFRSNKTINDIKGTRATVTLAERAVNYKHSHMSSSGSFWAWLSCCLGASEFAQTYSLLCNQFNKDNLTRFLYQLPEYLSWESLEGGPYIKMSNINANNNIPGSVNQVLIDNTYKKLLAQINNIPVKINKELIDVFQIEANEQLEQLILPVAGNAICNKIGNNYVLSGTQNNNQLNDYNREVANITMFKFKGKDIKPQVIPSTDDNKNAVKAPYPSLTQGIAKLLTKQINEYIISETNV